MAELKDLLVITDNLELEWAQQAIRAFHASELSARFERERQEAQEALRVEEAQAEKDIREGTNGRAILGKLTEKSVAAAIEGDDKVAALRRILIEKTYASNIAKGLEKAFSHRLTALKYIHLLHASPISDEERSLGKAARQNLIRNTLAEDE